MTSSTITNYIFLAIVPPNGLEVHVKWRGHTAIDTAMKELNQLRSMLVGEKKKPYDAYVYEAPHPPYGLRAYELDEIDMNFYEENSPEDLEEVNRKLEQAIREVGILAKEEAKEEAKA